MARGWMQALALWLVFVAGIGLYLRCDEESRERALAVGEAVLFCTGRGMVAMGRTDARCEGSAYRVTCDQGTWTEVCCGAEVCFPMPGAYQAER